MGVGGPRPGQDGWCLCGDPTILFLDRLRGQHAHLKLEKQLFISCSLAINNVICSLIQQVFTKHRLHARQGNHFQRTVFLSVMVVEVEQTLTHLSWNEGGGWSACMWGPELHTTDVPETGQHHGMALLFPGGCLIGVVISFR